MYEFFMDGVQLPVAPSKMSMKIRNTNKTITLMDDGEVNLLKQPGLTDIQLDVLLPNVSYPFARYPNGYQPALYYLEKLESLKIKKQPFQFIITRSKPNGDLLFDTNMKVSLEEYEIVEDAAENGFDIVVSISLKQYRDYGTKKITIKTPASTSQGTQKVTTSSTRPTTKSAPKRYTVVKGDTLWAICKKYLGDGSKYPAIAKLNGIKNPNLIYPGQVIRFE